MICPSAYIKPPNTIFFSYVLGSASQVLSAEGPTEQPVTLEYRGIVEQQLAEVISCSCFSLSYIVLPRVKMSHLLSWLSACCIVKPSAFLQTQARFRCVLFVFTNDENATDGTWMLPVNVLLSVVCVRCSHWECSIVAWERLFLIDYWGTGCTNDDISFVLRSPHSCDEQTLVSDITSSHHVAPAKWFTVHTI